MNARELYVIEKRDSEGRLVFTAPQPENVFGIAAIHGISEDGMARVVFRLCPDATLDGRHIATWPAFVDPQFMARRKTW